ncbi:FAD-binding oxidoreductase [Rhizorhabdus dicambivorans]|uniref:FAD-binding oxidoreductase n=1 Tax=Rhizorhabdus dicambivorans TaxID=1850238 RepID=A0A2A4G2K7_9SPHN|nr:FAD-binding oxidoreductase [Rhizorhabdus dicambivorans]ATE64983.1 FAD-binding oxidoreductase [Rhizorhabdus dicambivorans]PCE44256.1 FAD-binding oxidoreductase [Rhizorhabdus dicambivorans]
MTGLRPPDPALLDQLAAVLGPQGFVTERALIAPWLTDWRERYHGETVALLAPNSVEQVEAIVRLAAAARVAIVPQGGNTGTVAGATPPADGSALLLSLRRMNRIRSISAQDNAAIAEAGVVLSDLHYAAAAIGRRFPLSLAAKGSATIGGLVSTNAGGTQVLRFGPMRALVLGIEAVLADGSRFDGLATLRKDNRGYDLRQLLTGAEGTLGIVTAAAVRLVPAIGSRAVAWAGLPSPQDALTLLRRLEERTGDAVESFELVPASALALVLANIPGARPPLTPACPWNVLIEAVGSEGGPDPAEGLAACLASAIGEGLVLDAMIAASEAQAEALWRLRESISEAEKIDGPSLKHDISVPVSEMPAFLEREGTRIEAAFPGSRIIAFGHLGDGNIHFNLLPPEAAERSAWIDAHGEAASALVHDLVAQAGGSLSAEHGIGQAKLAEFVRLTDPVRLAALGAIKRALDPQGIMNPGKLVPLASDGKGQ